MLPDTLFRSLFLLAGMTTCGCYSQPEDTEMITSVVGSTNRTSSDLRYSVAMGEDRTWHRAIRSRLTRMYGPAVRCKRFSSRWHSAVLHQCIRSLIGAGLLRTIMDISARAFSLADRPQRANWVTSFRMRREDVTRRARDYWRRSGRTGGQIA